MPKKRTGWHVICQSFHTFFYTKFGNFWHITDLAISNCCIVITPRKQSGLGAHPVYCALQHCCQMATNCVPHYCLCVPSILDSASQPKTQVWVTRYCGRYCTGHLLGDRDLGDGVLANLLNHLALLANDTAAVAVVRQHFQHHLTDTHISSSLFSSA